MSCAKARFLVAYECTVTKNPAGRVKKMERVVVKIRYVKCRMMKALLRRGWVE